MNKKASYLAMTLSATLVGGCGNSAPRDEVDQTQSALFSNLLQNGDFSQSTGQPQPVVATTGSGGTPGGCIAANWETFLNSPNSTVTTELIPSTRRPGANMLHITSDGTGNNCIDQLWGTFGTGPAEVVTDAWLFVNSGQAFIGTGNGGNTGPQASTGLHDQGKWIHLQTPNNVSPANNTAVCAAGPADFYVDTVNVFVSPNLLTNPNFTSAGSNGTSTTCSAADMPTAADGWSCYLSAGSGQVSTTLGPDYFGGPGGSIYVSTNQLGAGIYQDFPVQSSVLATATVVVSRGWIALGSGGPVVGPDRIYIVNAPWKQLTANNGQSPASRFAISAYSPGGADFYVEYTHVQAVP